MRKLLQHFNMRTVGVEPTRVSPQDPKSRGCPGEHTRSECGEPIATDGNRYRGRSAVTLAVTWIVVGFGLVALGCGGSKGPTEIGDVDQKGCWLTQEIKQPDGKIVTVSVHYDVCPDTTGSGPKAPPPHPSGVRG